MATLHVTIVSTCITTAALLMACEENETRRAWLAVMHTVSFFTLLYLLAF